MWSKAGGTEGLRIIASISWGCVGDGDAGISLSSSQSNGIYVQHSGLQQGNKYLSLPQSHVVTPSPPTLPLSVCHLCIFTICVFIFPLVLCLHSTPTPPPFFPFAMHSLNLSRKEEKKKKEDEPSEFFLVYLHLYSVLSCWCSALALWRPIHLNVLYIQWKNNKRGCLSESEQKEMDEMQMSHDKSQQKK